MTGSSGIDAAGEVEYASPNALSAYRRLGLIGDLVDEHLASLTAELFPAGPGPVEESVQSVLSGRNARRTELVSGEAHLMVRVLPLVKRDPPGGRDRALPRRQRPPQQRNASWSPRTRPSGRSITG